MTIIAKEPESNYTPAPEGLHQAVCCDVIDRGLVKTQWGEQHKVDIRWQIELVNEETGKHFVVSNRYTCSLHEKANLRQHLEAWRGRHFTNEELAGFDLEKLLCANCQIQIAHNIAGNGKTYANVQAIVPLGKAMTKMRPGEDYTREKDRSPDNGNSNGDFEATEDDVPF